LPNPDLAVLWFIKDSFANLEVEFPDGAKAHFDHIDVGFQSKPSTMPYMSLHTVRSVAPIKRLGRGAGEESRNFAVELLISVEYEYHHAGIGFERLTTLRWEVFRHLLTLIKASGLHGHLDFDEAEYQTFNVDEGDHVDWGFFGQILIPVTLEFTPADLAKFSRASTVLPEGHPDHREPSERYP